MARYSGIYSTQRKYMQHVEIFNQPCKNACNTKQNSFNPAKELATKSKIHSTLIMQEISEKYINILKIIL